MFYYEHTETSKDEERKNRQTCRQNYGLIRSSKHERQKIEKMKMPKRLAQAGTLTQSPTIFILFEYKLDYVVR